jgi:hypothetical protein
MTEDHFVHPHSPFGGTGYIACARADVPSAPAGTPELPIAHVNGFQIDFLLQRLREETRLDLLTIV